MRWLRELLVGSGESSGARPIKRRGLSWSGWQECGMPDWVQEALDKSDLDIDRDDAPAKWTFEVNGKTFRYRVVVEAGFVPGEGRPVLSERCYRKRLKNKNGRTGQRRRLAYRTKTGKPVWLYATDQDDFDPGESWTCTGRRSVTNGWGSGRIREGLPEWVWNVLAEAPRIDEGTGRVYLVNGKHHQYLHSMFVTDDGNVFRETYQREKR